MSVMNKLHEQMGIVLKQKYNEIDKLLKPYTKTLEGGLEEVNIPNEEVAFKYEKLNKEFKKIVEEIRLMHQN